MEATNNILDSMSFSIGAEIAFTDEQSDSVIDFPSSSGHQSSRIPPILQQRVKKRKSWVFLPEHGTEYTQGGRIYWRCARCPQRGIKAVTFADSSTKNMLDHLSIVYELDKNGPYCSIGVFFCLYCVIYLYLSPLPKMQ
ncbi:uncharacterized protein LAJ45_04837 [Morchella importuna]|uniref:uncharacterized protein n=1 Tax=Morchella importuna TaxID=1174673 RepID=UPI001E8E8AF1|nr:uncharacterized protein LAJ45_04837 [Morchella importuna]KAH8151135.1 hypothetical protein LAJ45_04837 [Morchella importuna]